MLFNSIDFAIFLPIVFLTYWFLASHNVKLQNLIVVIASYIFYSWWDVRFLILIVFSTIVDYLIALQLSRTHKHGLRKTLLITSVLVNLGLLFFFKYYNFFINNFVDTFLVFGLKLEVTSLNIILPVGISFYTFQTLSYTIDVYKEKLRPTNNFIAFSAFVSFFPQLVAGPIERASNLLPQFYVKRNFSYDKAVDGMRQILWGLFKKVVIADTCAQYVNEVFTHSENYSGSTLLVGATFFAFQIYGDFSGYSDIAIGVSRLFGFNLMQNFAFPYFSRDVAEFWRRWHISLSTWFRDYLYIPLGGSRVKKIMKIRNVLMVFIISGFWHGANWTFIIWGTLHALFYLPMLLNKSNRKHLNIVAYGSYLPSVKEILKIIYTFFLITIAWIFFRAEDVFHALNYITIIFSESLFSIPEIRPTYLFLLIVFFIVIEWFGRTGNYALEKMLIASLKVYRYAFYLVLSVLIILFLGKTGQEFIYFQF